MEWICGWKQIECPHGNRTWAIIFMDIESRFVVSYGCCDTPSIEYAVAVLKQGIDKYGTPFVIITNNKPPFISSQSPFGEIDEFDKYLEDNSIKHSHSINTHRILTPFWRELTKRPMHFKNFGAYVHWHNEVKPHTGIGWEWPNEVFGKNLKRKIT